jgi:hypothetical protein
MPSYTRLKGVTDVSQSTLCDQLESNIIEFFNWGMLCIGGFNNVQIGAASGAYGGDMSRLRPVSDPNYINGQVWEGFRQDWVWQSGIEYVVQPIPVSGVYINSVFYPLNTTGVYSHHINYPLGRVTFDNPLPTDGSAVVQANYSYRLYTFQTSDQNWFRQVMFESFRVDKSDFLQFGSGVWNVLAQDRVQLPAVVVDVIPRRSMYGYELGGTVQVHQDILFHIFTENPYDRKSMLDYITYQKDKTIPLFDKNLMSAANAFPLDYNGSIASGAMCFPDLVKPTGQGGFFWRGGAFVNMNSQETISTPPLYQAVIRCTFEVNLLIV